MIPLNLTSEEMQERVRHQTNERQKRYFQKHKHKTVECAVCHVFVKNFNQHLKSKKHQRNEERQDMLDALKYCEN